MARLTPDLMQAVDQATEALPTKWGAAPVIRSLVQDAIVLNVAEAEEAGCLEQAVTALTQALSTVHERDVEGSDFLPVEISRPHGQPKRGPPHPSHSRERTGQDWCCPHPPPN